MKIRHLAHLVIGVHYSSIFMGVTKSLVRNPSWEIGSKLLLRFLDRYKLYVPSQKVKMQNFSSRFLWLSFCVCELNERSTTKLKQTRALKKNRVCHTGLKKYQNQTAVNCCQFFVFFGIFQTWFICIKVFHNIRWHTVESLEFTLTSSSLISIWVS